jgi:hypothetical protein
MKATEVKAGVLVKLNEHAPVAAPLCSLDGVMVFKDHLVSINPSDVLVTVCARPFSRAYWAVLICASSVVVELNVHDFDPVQ